MARNLLLSFVYYNAVGHTAEALKYAKGFAEANPDIDVHLLHRSDAPVELADGCDWISGVFPIDLRADPAESLGLIPREWDWVVDDNLLAGEVEAGIPVGHDETRMLAFIRAAKAYFVARLGRGELYPTRRLPEGLEYRVNAPIRIQLPAEVKRPELAEDGPNIAVMLGGSSGRGHYPSVRSWLEILRAIEDAFPAVRIHFTGATRPLDGRTYSTYTAADIRKLREGVTRATTEYDIGLWQQLALIERCDAFLSPHTGFAFLALCVETPWVAISGGNWPEWFFNEVPFYSALPDNPDYPYEGRIDWGRNRPKIRCMESARIAARIPDILDGIRLVLDPAFTYDAALERHRRNVAAANVRREAIPLASTF